jgi:TldD protein
LTDVFSNQWKDLLETLLNRGARAGADLVEVFLERTNHVGVLAEQDQITSVNPSFSKGAGLRVCAVVVEQC